MRAVCVLGYHTDSCYEIRQRIDNQFAKTKTSILNIYAPCYNQTQPSGKKTKMRQSGRVTDLDEGSCEDSKGGNFWFNDPMIQE